jgi:hypothetical protein
VRKGVVEGGSIRPSHKAGVERHEATARDIRWLAGSLALTLLEIAVLLAAAIAAIFLLVSSILALFVSDQYMKGLVLLGLFACSCVFMLWLGKTFDRWVHAHRYTGPPLVPARHAPLVLGICFFSLGVFLLLVVVHALQAGEILAARRTGTSVLIHRDQNPAGFWTVVGYYSLLGGSQLYGLVWGIRRWRQLAAPRGAGDRLN